MNILDSLIPIEPVEYISGLTDELKGIYIKNYFAKTKKSILFVCNSLYEANKLYQIIKNHIDNVLFFPMDDFMTSQVLAVSPDLKISRLETLHALKEQKPYIIITNLMGYLRFLKKPDVFYDSYIKLDKNSDYDIKQLKEQLYDIGYTKEVLVNKSGEMAARGFVVDIFPIHEENPLRLEFWGDTIDSIRYFDVDSQLTIKEVDTVTIMPNSELLINNTNETTASIYNYLENATVFYNDYSDLEISYHQLQEEMVSYCEEANLPLSTVFMNDFYQINPNKTIDFCQFDNNLDKANSQVYTSYHIEDKFIKLDDIKTILNNYRKKYAYIVLCVSNRYQANKILETLDDKNILFTDSNNIVKNKINIIIQNITEGFIFKDYVFISENELFNRKTTYNTYKTNFKYGTRIKDITALEIGDYIVHNIHGIGRYCGIKTITKNKLIKDYLQIEYKDGDKLYIPVEKIDMISKYSSNEGSIPKLNKLGSLEWEKTKLRAKKRAQDIADEILKLYALREMKEGFAFQKDDDMQLAFEKEFLFEETKDQSKAIEEIKEDMEANHPMDRLLCGDVGYGKTEVAFRAAFKAILSGKQVALLCPTTILSNQHYLNAQERFRSFPTEIRLLNRFVSVKNTKKTLQDVKDGKVDFLIGTHKLLNDKIEFKDLGLLIIDEEQRFGVIHKEKIKKYKENIDVLTLSATPIPRTLQMSMSGLRGLSLIETPPSNRYPVQTYVLAYNRKILKDAIYKELSRQGQAFVLYNHVDDIESKTREIQDLVPEAKVVYAHGRMNKQQLEDIMLQFINKEYDVLVCTTIIETGIDIPNVNTLLVMDADKFGLSQLYQLRGRVGRTNRIAYCYLMYNNEKVLTEIATKRLNAIKEFTELGSGLSIAMRDLAIRGAGDLLGSEQAGFIDSVGIELFTKMLKEEIDKLRGIIKEDTKEELQPLVEVNTYVDDSYVEDEELKIEIHRKINAIDSFEKLEDVKQELEDRFGKLSDQLIIYMHEEWFEHLANKLGIRRVRQTETNVDIILDKDLTSKINGEKLFVDILSISRDFRFKTQGKNLIISLPLKKLEKHFIYYLIDLLQAIEKAI